MAEHRLIGSDNRWGNWRKRKREALATGEYRRAERALVVDCDRRTEEERRADNSALALRLGVSRRCFI